MKLGGKLANAVFVDVDFAPIRAEAIFDHTQIDVEHLSSLRRVKFWIVEADMDNYMN